MDAATVAAVLALVLSFAGMLVFARRLESGKTATSSTAAAGAADAAPAPARGGGRRAGGTARMRRRQQLAADNDDDVVVGGAGGAAGDDDDDDGDDGASGAGKKIGKKKARKLAEKEQRRLAREQEERELQERKAQRKEAERAEKKQKEKDDAARKIEEEKEAEAKRLREEEERKEYEAIKASFTLEDTGTVEEEIQQESQGLLQEFIEYIKETKVVNLEELASHFKLPAQDAVRRVVDLESMGRISGVIDDRGKFIYVSPEEMEAVAAYIRKQGRVGISDLAVKTAELIHLEQAEAAAEAVAVE